jgi:hypothetical protein
MFFAVSLAKKCSKKTELLQLAEKVNNPPDKMIILVGTRRAQKK